MGRDASHECTAVISSPLEENPGGMSDSFCTPLHKREGAKLNKPFWAHPSVKDDKKWKLGLHGFYFRIMSERLYNQV